MSSRRRSQGRQEAEARAEAQRAAEVTAAAVAKATRDAETALWTAQETRLAVDRLAADITLRDQRLNDDEIRWFIGQRRCADEKVVDAWRTFKEQPA